MGLRMKNFNILSAHWIENPAFREGGSQKTDGLEQGGIAQNMELGQFADLKGAWQERRGGVFEGGWYPDDVHIS